MYAYEHESGRDFATVPAFYNYECQKSICTKVVKRRFQTNNKPFTKKIGKNYCRLKNNAYICIVVNDVTARMRPVPRTKTGQIMTTLKYTTKAINREFKIKVSGLYDGKKINTLVGVSGLIRLVNDIELANRLLDRAFDCRQDVCVCKLRRGIKISFYVF